MTGCYENLSRRGLHIADVKTLEAVYLFMTSTVIASCDCFVLNRQEASNENLKLILFRMKLISFKLNNIYGLFLKLVSTMSLRRMHNYIIIFKKIRFILDLNNYFQPIAIFTFRKEEILA